MKRVNGLKQAYTRAVHQLAVHYHKDPECITEKELEDYYLYVIEREWKHLTILKAQKEERLPEIPAQESIKPILSCVTTFYNFVFFSTVYACGLRLQEALNIQIPDINGKPPTSQNPAISLWPYPRSSPVGYAPFPRCLCERPSAYPDRISTNYYLQNLLPLRPLGAI
jgi:hypothetical protein